MEAISVCRTRQKAGLDLVDYPLPFWAEKAHVIGVNTYSQVEAEMSDEDGPETEKGADFGVRAPGDSGAFDLIHQHIETMAVRSVKNVYGRKHDSSGGYIDSDVDG